MMNKYIQSLARTFAMSALLSLFIATDILCIFLDVRSIHTSGFEEDGFVEWWQQIQLAITVLILILSMKKNRSERPALILMAGCLAAGLFREFNNFLNDSVFHGACTALVVMALLATAFFVYRKRDNLLAACYHFTRTPSFGITLAGFFVTFIFSRVMGTPGLWHSVLETHYTRHAERMVEESTELVGYTIMAFGICHYVASLKMLRQLVVSSESLQHSASAEMN